MSSLPPELAELAAVADFAPHLAQAFASLACDLALVLDSRGVITRVAHNPGGGLAGVTAGWVGQPMVDTVTRESRHKVEALLAEMAAQGLARRREVNLPRAPAPDIPVAYTALRLGPGGPALAVGQDLRAVPRCSSASCVCSRSSSVATAKHCARPMRRGRVPRGRSSSTKPRVWHSRPG